MCVHARVCDELLFTVFPSTLLHKPFSSVKTCFLLERRKARVRLGSASCLRESINARLVYLFNCGLFYYTRSDGREETNAQCLDWLSGISVHCTYLSLACRKQEPAATWPRLTIIICYCMLLVLDGAAL